LPKLTSAALVAGRGEYIADVELDRPLEVAFARSPYAHATINAVELPEGAGIDGAGLAQAVRPLTIEGPGLRQCPWPALATGKVRYVGEPVAAVWAEDRYLAEDLVDQVMVDYDPLPDGEPLHEGVAGDVLFELEYAGGDLDAAMARADHVFEYEFRCARQTPLPMEGRGVAATFDAEAGTLTVWTSTQIPNLVRTGLARALGVQEDRIRVLVPHVGGGFGLKAHLFPEEIVVAHLARELRRSVRWVEDRRENLIASAHAHDETVRLTIGTDGGGRILGVSAEVTCDVGAYSIYPFSASLEPTTTAGTLFGPYAIEAIRYRTIGRASSRCPAGAYRGVGMNAAVYATERAVDLVAGELGLDHVEIRRNNAVRVFPTTTAANRPLDSGDYLGLLDLLVKRGQYDEMRRLQAEARAQGRLVGVGVGLFNEHSGTGAADYRKRGIFTIPGTDAARVTVTAEGRIEIRTSAAEAGQGHQDAYREIAAREFGIDPALVDVFEGDTDLCPPGTGTFVSRGGVGGIDCVVQALREAADQDLAPGTDVTSVAEPTQVYPSGAHLAMVEVDPVSYVPSVVRYVAVEDCGTVVSHSAVEGQVRGGVAMGIGGVLLEEHVYSPDGQILTSSLLDYLVPLATDVPPVEMDHVVSPSPHTRLGSKGVGEGGTIGAFAAVANAVADAVAPTGAVLTRLPYSPSAIFEAIFANH
jgi:carbon-monoxide dehydrogenase large subunit